MMVRNILEVQPPKATADATHRDSSRGLHATLWILWTVAVAATALFNWYSDVAAGQPVNLLGLAIYSALTGSIGLVVMTLLEMWLDPQRFID
jgi:hypothetical protein